MGIVVVVALATKARLGLPRAVITATRRRTKSANSVGSLSCWPSAQRYDRDVLHPNVRPP